MTAKISLGKFELFRIVEYEGPVMEISELFPNVTREIIDAHKAWMVPRFYEPDSDSLIMATQSFLVKTPDHNILVDTCSGNLKNRKRPLMNQQNWPWMETLSKTGTHPNDIDIVICTHLHVDHVGWNTEMRDGRWVPTFPRAQYIIVEKDFEYWRQLAKETGLPRTGDYFEDSVKPICDSGQMLLVDEEYIIEDGVWFEPLIGHSPGHVAVHLRSGNNEAVLAGDVLHSPLQFFYPDWSCSYCVDQSLSRKTRHNFLKKYADSGIYCLPAHFPSPTAVFIERNGDKFNYRLAG